MAEKLCVRSDNMAAPLGFPSTSMRAQPMETKFLVSTSVTMNQCLNKRTQDFGAVFLSQACSLCESHIVAFIFHAGPSLFDLIWSGPQKKKMMGKGPTSLFKIQTIYCFAAQRNL